MGCGGFACCAPQPWIHWGRRKWREMSEEKVWRVGFIPHTTLSVWSGCLWDSVGPMLIKELGPLYDVGGGKNTYGQWVGFHPVAVRRWQDGVVRLVVVEVPRAALGRLTGSDAEYEQYKIAQRWSDHLLKKADEWGQPHFLSEEAAPVL